MESMIAGYVCYASRQLMRNPLFALTAVLTLAVGISANTAAFSVVDAVLIHPLPFPQPEKIVLVNKHMPKSNSVKSDSWALDDLDYWRFSKSFSNLAAFAPRSFNITGDPDPDRVFGLRVSPNLLPLLGVHALLGRAFREEETQPGRNRVALLAEPLWKARFGSDPRVLGRQVLLDGEIYTVIGVIAPILQFLDISQIYVPLTFDAKDLAPDVRGHQFLSVIGRLRPDTTLGRTRAEMKVVAAQMTQALPSSYPPGWSIVVEPLREFVGGDLRAPLLVLMTGLGILLMMTCASITNLSLARAASRRREIAIRRALGARRSDISAQLLTESLLLAALAGALGLILGGWMLAAAARFAPPELLRMQEPHINGWVAAFTTAISLGTTFDFGLAPVLSIGRMDVNEALKEGGGVPGRQSSHHLRNTLVAVEVTSSVVLLIAAGLLVRSFIRVQTVDPGFRADHLLTARLSLPGTRYPGPSQIREFYSELRSQIAAIPGVMSVGFANGIPFGAGAGGGPFTIVGQPWSLAETVPDVGRRIISPGYLETLRTPLKAGRFFGESDGPEAPPVAVVDELFSRTLFPNGDALGHDIAEPGPAGQNSVTYRIVGIAAGMKDRNLIRVPVPRVQLALDGQR